SWGNGAIPGIDFHQLALNLSQAKLNQQRLVSNSSVFHFFDRAPDGFANTNDLRKVSFVDKVRTQIRRQAPATEDQLRALETLIEQSQRLARQIAIVKEFVVMGYRLIQHEH